MLVIIPGWMHDAAQWDVVSNELHMRKIEHKILDLPGFGTIPADPSITTLANLSDYCLKEIFQIKTNSDTPLVLFGHSCGGRISLQLVANQLSVSHLILSGSPNLYRPTMKVQLLKFASKILSPMSHYIPERAKRRLRSDDYSAARNSPMQTLYQSVVQDDQENLLSKINCEVSLLWGELDDAAPLRIAEELHSKLPTSTLYRLPHQGHNLHQENPQLLAGKIATLLQYD